MHKHQASNVAMHYVLMAFLIVVLLTMGCIKDRVKDGRDLFHGAEVNVKASQRAKKIVIVPGTEICPFDGNCRSCASCHKAENKFGMSMATLQSLPADDLFFYDGLDEDITLLTEHGMVHVIGDGLDEFRRTPALNELCTLCDPKTKLCESMGLNSDRTILLPAFIAGAVVNHHSKTEARVPGVDFTPATAKQLKDLTDYMLSSNVCKGL